MFTTGSKWFFGLGAVSFVLAVLYGYSTGGDRLGPVTAGYWGAVGDHLGYTLLVSIGVAATFLGITSLMSRDANPRSLAELAGTDEAPPAVAPAHVVVLAGDGSLRLRPGRAGPGHQQRALHGGLLPPAGRGRGVDGAGLVGSGHR